MIAIRNLISTGIFLLGKTMLVSFLHTNEIFNEIPPPF